MNAYSARLVVQTGPNPGQIINLGTLSSSLGREATNNIVLNDPEISRRHARLIPQGTGFLLEDLNSTNGTYVNGQQVTGRVLLQSGDVIQLGESVQLVFEMPAGAPTVIHARTTLDHNTPVEQLKVGKVGTMPSRPPELDLLAPGKLYEAPPSRYKAMPLEFEAAAVEPAAPLQPPLTAEPDLPAARSRRRPWVTCAIVLLLLLVACTATVFWLDAYHPDTLYGPLEPLFRLLGLME